MLTARVAGLLVAGLLLATPPRDDARDREAVETLVRETTLHPRDADAWYRLGAAYEATGMRLLAIRSYRRALRFDPHHARATRRLKSLDRLTPSDGTRWAD